MRVIAEFVDARNGKRYFPGDGNRIKPDLEPKQIERLTKAGCLEEGDEEASASSKGRKKVDYRKMTVEQLKMLAVDRKIELGDASKKDDIVAAIELADEQD